MRVPTKNKSKKAKRIFCKESLAFLSFDSLQDGKAMYLGSAIKTKITQKLELNN